MADDEDPFDEFEDVADREGDPFDDLGYPADEDAPAEEAVDPEKADREATEGPRTPPSEDPAGGPPEADRDPDPEAQGAPSAGAAAAVSGEIDPRAGEAGASSRDAGEVQGEVSPQERRGDPFGDEEGVFERVDVGDMDPDAVFEEFAEAEQRGTFVGEAERVFSEVDKHRYCEACKWFSSPPEVHCTHGGTEILEFLDMDTVRVVDCPVVEERKQLGERE
jgi:hypothetical protein